MSSPPPHAHESYIPTLPDGRAERPGLATAIAIVDLVAAAVSLVLGALMVIGAVTGTDSDAIAAGVFGGVFVLMGLLALASGVGLLLVRPWGRIVQIVTSIVGLCCLGLGTIVNALILAYMFQRHVALAYSGRRVADMSEPERQVLIRPAGSGGSVAVIVVAAIAGVFVMIAVMGILAAIAIPNFLSAIDRGKQKRTMADMRAIATAVEARATDFNAYPQATSVDELIPALVPTYAASLPTKDAWDHPFDVSTTDVTYALRSAGKDGAFELDAPELYPHGATTSFADDIVFANGEFLRYPEGTQR